MLTCVFHTFYWIYALVKVCVLIYNVFSLLFFLIGIKEENVQIGKKSSYKQSKAY